MVSHPELNALTPHHIRNVARFLRHIDDGLDYTRRFLSVLWQQAGQAGIIGVTGPPGVGKSTLVNRMISAFRGRGYKHVGVLAIDPSSPFSGGAILGDRIRMSEHFNDPGVFIRSLATRGATGGLSINCYQQIIAMDAIGFNPIIVETVGVGQDEVDIMEIAQTTIVVSVPGLGDTIQALKSGLMEIADIHCINKSDLPGVGKLRSQLNSLLQIREATRSQDNTQPAIILVTATSGKGVNELLQAIEDHQRQSRAKNRGYKTDEIQLGRYITKIAGAELARWLQKGLKSDKKIQSEWRAVVEGQQDPYNFIRRVFPLLWASSDK